jgi:probable F420-dependent oxidoreductase
MMQRTLGRIGLWSGAFDAMPVGQCRDVVAALDDQGWSTLWLAEGTGREAFTQAQMLLTASTRIGIATGIASIYARDAVATNAASRLLTALYGDRFLLGLGVSHRPMVEEKRGHTYHAPVQAMASYLQQMDSVASYAAEASEDRPPRVLAALGPRMIDLARRSADGAHGYLVTPEFTDGARERLGAGPLLVIEQAVILEEDSATLLERAHAHLASGVNLDNYRGSWLRMGFTEADLVPGGSDRLAQSLVIGGLRRIRSRIEEHLAAGADQVCLQVLSAPSDLTAAWKELSVLVAEFEASASTP